MAVTTRFGFALEYVSDIDAVKRFYVDVLGLEVDREHPTFVQFKDPAGHPCYLVELARERPSRRVG